MVTLLIAVNISRLKMYLLLSGVTCGLSRIYNMQPRDFLKPSPFRMQLIYMIILGSVSARTDRSLYRPSRCTRQESQ